MHNEKIALKATQQVLGKLQACLQSTWWSGVSISQFLILTEPPLWASRSHHITLRE